MEAKEIVARYKEQIVAHQEPVKRAVEPVEAPIDDNGTSNTLRDDNMSFLKACEALDINPKEITEASRGRLEYIISEMKKLGSKEPEKDILSMLSRIGSPPVGQDVVSHLATYLKVRASAESIGEIKD